MSRNEWNEIQMSIIDERVNAWEKSGAIWDDSDIAELLVTYENLER